MLRTLTTPFRWLAAQLTQRPAEAAPILPGYRRPPSRLLVVALLALLFAVCVAQGFYFGVLAPSMMMPFVLAPSVLAVLVIWALPRGDNAPTRLLEPLFVAFFASLVVWPNYLSIALPSLPWVTLLRLFGFPLMAVFMTCISMSQRFRRQLGDVLMTDKRIWQLLVGVVALQVLTMPMAGSEIGNSLNRFIIAQVNWTGMFFVAAYLFRRPGFAETWVKILLALTTMVGVMGVWESRLQQLPWVGYIPSFLANDDPVVAKILAPHARAASAELYRCLSVSTTPLGTAEMLGLALPFAVHLAVSRYHIVVRVLAALWIPFSIHVILLTQSRLGLIACLSTLAFYVLIWAVRRWRTTRGSLIGPAVVLAYPALFLMLVGAVLLIGKLRSMVLGNGTQAASDQARKEQWVTGIQKLEKNPFGYGMGRASDVVGYHTGKSESIDSYYLSVLIEIGVLGFIIYFGLMLRAAYLGYKTATSNRTVDREILLIFPMTVALINFVIVKSVLSQDANHPLIFMMLGAVLALAWRAQNRSPVLSAAAEVAAATAPQRVPPRPALAGARA